MGWKEKYHGFIVNSVTFTSEKRYKMNQHIAQITLLVADYDEAIQFYTQKLHFNLIEDTVLSETKRWVRIAPQNSSGCCLLLAKAANKEQLAQVGNQCGGRVFVFLYTDDFSRDYQNLLNQNVRIMREPSVETYGTVAVFADLYGNLWDLIEPAK
jgi:catechol 2,3-dioxygenase-like lactoylglutathione lyase family enzyme